METEDLPKHSFSACWSEKLGEAIKANATLLGTAYHVSMRSGEDFESLKAAINQGIDSHLEAVGLKNQEVKSDATGNRWSGKIASDTLHVLVRRLLEADDETSANLASSICQTLNIELI